MIKTNDFIVRMCKAMRDQAWTDHLLAVRLDELGWLPVDHCFYANVNVHISPICHQRLCIGFLLRTYEGVFERVLEAPETVAVYRLACPLEEALEKLGVLPPPTAWDRLGEVSF